jgi:hypothetical protein
LQTGLHRGAELNIFNSAMADKQFSSEEIRQRLAKIPAVQTFGYR